MYSIFQLPEDRKHRQKILSKIIEKKKKIYLACEKISIINKKKFQGIENLWLIKKTIPFCYKYKF